MGMFDYVRCDWPLPVTPRVTPYGLQSKDGPCEMGEVVISANGRLLFEDAHIEDVSEEQRPYFGTPKWGDEDSVFRLAGCLRRVVDRMVDQEFHGDFYFYGGGYNFVARFTHGQLETLTATPEAA